ncbi:hypothetical protein G4Y79_18850 [Phototrophicus methaneseepsis]|uniref:Uncharacterized protein n=1 Tax=Phototrophicus methaneseepsis TaxID=2710758 RepID=A0A7S8E7E6_9CHLR|nr:hypothetical protein [Phototrophicus methaneseepsis]QPC81731.1 hypothetical protein G4Y79_18850 [Phototrophicus methaneseepsis]
MMANYLEDVKTNINAYLDDLIEETTGYTRKNKVPAETVALLSACWFVIGIAVGAVFMYFFDPQHGNRRRSRLSDSSEMAE